MTSDAHTFGRVWFSELTPRKVDWLWPGYVPFGKLTILEGDPGTGKSTVLGDIAARVTTGLPMPGSSQSNIDGPRGAVYLAGEEDAEDTLLPRLLAAGGDPTRVLLRQEIRQSHERLFPTIEDVEWIEADIQASGAVLVIIDPLTEFLPSSASTISDASMRTTLSPLRELAQRLNVAIVIIRHLRKARSERLIHAGAGSIGIGGVARSVLRCLRNPVQPAEQLLVSAKLNLGKEPPGQRYRIVDHEGVGVVEWLGEGPLHSWELEQSAFGTAAAPSREDAERFLLDTLEDGPVACKAIRAAAADAGQSWATVRRAEHSLGVLHTKDGMSGGWIWSLPTKTLTQSEGAQFGT